VVDLAPENEPAVETAETETQTFTDDGELFPRIPLSNWDESKLGKASAEDRTRDADVYTGEEGTLDYGLTRKGDNLWKIAKKMQSAAGDDVTMYQIMMALYQSNPQAFVENNIHRLRVGHVMRIEDPGLLTAMSKQQAAGEYMAQTQAWEEYRQQVAETTPEQPIVAGGAGSNDASMPANESGELTLSAPDGEKLAAGGEAAAEKQDNQANSDALVLREEIRQALAEAQTERGKNEALNSHLRELEEKLNNMQRSLTVRDDELAVLQQQLSDVNTKTSEAEEAARLEAEHAARLEAEHAAQEQTKAAEPVEPAMPDAPVETLKDSPVADSPLMPAAPEQVIDPSQSQPDMIDKAIAWLAGAMATVSGVFATMQYDPLTMGIGGGVIIVLLIIMLLMKKRRNAIAFQESILTGTPSGSSANSGILSLESGLSEESSFLSDFAISGASTISPEDSEVDPLTEADVFMAYGRFEAAEERLVSAIRNEPNREELRVKLLELYNTNKNKTSFEAAAEEYYAKLGDKADSNANWRKVVAMGAALAPG
ncbi:MAG: hypothetical protein OEY00_14025, partial [Gammaproteobacteria bacterium]|nr:hypothetical protein [Gammaproteobacteria bacterium]